MVGWGERAAPNGMKIIRDEKVLIQYSTYSYIVLRQRDDISSFSKKT